MGTVSLEILKNYILSEGGVVTSQQIVRHFQPFLKDPENKARNKDLFKSYLSTLTDYRHEEGSNVRILELKKNFRTDEYYNQPPPKESKENTPRNEPAKHPSAVGKFSKPSYDQLQPMRDLQARDRPARTQNTSSVRPDRTNPEQSRKVEEMKEKEQENGVAVTPTRADRPIIRTASINAINMFNRTAQQKVQQKTPRTIPETTTKDKADTLESNGAEEFREEMESGCSNVTLEQSEKEWILKSAIGDCDTISRLLLTEKSLVAYKDFISGYTGLHWSCKLGRLDLTRVLLDAGSDPCARSNSGQTPLHLAAQTGKGEVVDLLLKHGANKEARDYKGKKPGHYLPSNASEAIKLLIGVPDPRINNIKTTQRKFSKQQTMLGFDGFSENTPKRHHTINQAWKKLKAPSGFKSSFVTKKSKKELFKMDSNKRETLSARPRSSSLGNIFSFGDRPTISISRQTDTLTARRRASTAGQPTVSRDTVKRRPSLCIGGKTLTLGAWKKKGSLTGIDEEEGTSSPGILAEGEEEKVVGVKELGRLLESQLQIGLGRNDGFSYFKGDKPKLEEEEEERGEDKAPTDAAPGPSYNELLSMLSSDLSRDTSSVSRDTGSTAEVRSRDTDSTAEVRSHDIGTPVLDEYDPGVYIPPDYNYTEEEEEDEFVWGRETSSTASDEDYVFFKGGQYEEEDGW